MLDEVVQDYVQHGGNVVGEVAAHRGWTPIGFLRRIIELGDTYEGGHSIATVRSGVPGSELRVASRDPGDAVAA